MNDGPLAGLLVADFSRILAGPYLTMLLADLGADVIKVEGPSGDDTRNWVPPLRDGVSTYYLSINRNKKSIALDFKDSEDLKLAKELAARADIVVENFKPGGLAAYGLDFAAVAARNPAVIYASITGFGGGSGALPGFDLIVQAVSGMMSLTGDADGSPYRSGIAMFDVITGLHAGVGILAALQHRNSTGAGQHIEVSLMASALSGMVNQTNAYVAGGVVPMRMGNSHPSLFPYEPFATGEGDLVIAVGNDGQFGKLCEVLGAAELPKDPRFAAQRDRSLNRDDLRPLLVELLSNRSATQWAESLLAIGVPCGPINTIDGGVAYAEELGLDPIVSVEGMPSVRNPITFSATPPRYDLAPPEIDADGAAIRDWLNQPRD